MDYKAEDFLQDDTFIGYCLRNDEAAIHFWNDYLTAHPGQAEEMKKAERLYFILNGNITPAVFEHDRLEFVEAFTAFQHLAPEGPAPVLPLPARHHIRFGLPARIAAACVAAAIIGFSWFGLTHTKEAVSPPPVASLIQESRRGERKSFQLSDGTQITLNAGSTLTVSKEFNRGDRKVILNGEAYFEVARDKDLPFIIHTENMDIKVLGTVFNVKAYDGDRQTETSLISGSVEVTLTSQGNRKVILRPAEKIVFNKENIKASGDTVASGLAASRGTQFKVAALTTLPGDSSYNEISWLENRLSFKQETLESIAQQLDRWYNISIVFGDQEVKQYRYTGTFQKKTIRQILDALQLSKPFSYSISDEQKVLINK